MASLQEGNSIYVLYRKKNAISGQDITYVPKERYRELFSKVQIDWVINCAGVYQKESNENMMEGNLIYPLQIMDAALSYGVKNIMNINTALPANLNFYSFTKKEFGRFGNFYADSYNLNFYNLLVEMFYGPDEPKDRFFSAVADKLKQDSDVELTEGRQKRDIVHVDDVCQAVKLIMRSGWRGYHDVPVGTGEGRQVRELVEYMHKRMNSSSKLLFGAIPMRKNEPDSIADISLLKKLGYKVTYSWKSGLDKLIEGVER